MAGRLKFYGANWCPDCSELKHFFGEHKVGYDWIDIDQPNGAQELTELTGGKKITPVLKMPDGTVLVEPSLEDVAGALGIPLEKECEYHDLAIIGSGPTGMGAAIYTTREEIKTTLFEKKIIGGLASITDQIDNYPGFPDGVAGIELSASMEKQARRFGADFKVGVEVRGIADEGKYKRIETTQGVHYAKSVLIATGTDYKKLNVPGEEEFTSRGVHYCATCDGAFYKDKTLIVVGGGNSAMQESLFLTRFASKITILVRGAELKGTEFLINKIKGISKIEVVYGIGTSSIEKDDQGMILTADTSAGPQEFRADGIFVFIGLIPNTGWVTDGIKLDERGFIVTDKTFETSMPGVFAAGDVRSGATLQIASAVGEGVTSALMIREYLKEEG